MEKTYFHLQLENI